MEINEFVETSEIPLKKLRVDIKKRRRGVWMKNEYMLLQYYIKYLKQVRNLSDSSVDHYTQAINRISKLLRDRELINDTIYELKDIGELEIMRNYVYRDSEFIALDTRGNRMYSAGLNNYYRFALGEELFEKKDSLRSLDMVLPVGEKTIITHEEWKRSSIIKLQTLEAAGFKCEINQNHNTFKAQSNDKQYMEGHHAIPMHYQDKFNQSIDVYANVICLCPICHRLLHYGKDLEKKQIINQLYETRKDRLEVSGIKISKKDFTQLAI